MSKTRVQCPQCGARFKIAAEALGRKGRCTKCDHVFVLTGEEEPDDALDLLGDPYGFRAELAGKGPADVGKDATDIPFEAERDAQWTCPSCGHAGPQGSVICTNCGYDTRAGRRLQTDVGEEAVPDPRYASSAPPGDLSEPDFVGKQVARINRNMLSWNGLIAAVIIGALGYTNRYWHNWFHGPFDEQLATLAGESDPASRRRYYCTIAGDEVVDTESRQITQRKRKSTGEVVSERVSAEYLVLRQGPHLLIVEADPERQAGTVFTGLLREIPDDIRRGIIADVPDADVRAAFIPAMLEQGPFGGEVWFFLIAGSILLLLSGLNLVKVAWRTVDPFAHPIYRKLSRYGEAREVARLVNDGLQGPGVSTIGHCIVSPNWIIGRQHFYLEVVPFHVVVWVYGKHVETHRSGSTEHDYSVCLHLHDGKTVSLRTKEAHMQPILRNIDERAPWALVGYDDKLDELWKNHRDEFIAAVDFRRQAIMAPGGGRA